MEINNNGHFTSDDLDKNAVFFDGDCHRLVSLNQLLNIIGPDNYKVRDMGTDDMEIYHLCVSDDYNLYKVDDYIET